jgi:hypothetical protein
MGQNSPAPTPPPTLPVEQLANLVAPIALYPDPLLAQVLAASTYPLEIVEAQQWLHQNRNLQGAQLIQAAGQQNWDASVQALVAFPDALTLLARDIRWTTDLGNAFLAQRQDVMSAIQNLRAQAQNNGQLVSGPQQAVTNEAQNGQNAVVIQPANPQVMYVPVYNPQAVWGPQIAPPMGYGAGYAGAGYAGDYGYGGGSGGGFGGSTIGYGAGVLLNALFTGLTHFSGWGWGLNWLTQSLFQIPSFFGGSGVGGNGYSGPAYAGNYSALVWEHNPSHRLGVAYPTRSLASSFGGGYSTRPATYRSDAFRSAWNNSGNGRYSSGAPQYSRSNYPTSNGYRSYGYVAPHQFAQGNYYGSHYSEPRASAPRSYAALPAQHYSEPKAPHYSAPKMPHFSSPKAPKAPKMSGGHGGGKSHSGKHH